MKVLVLMTAAATALTLSATAQTASSASTSTLAAPHHTQVAQSSAAAASSKGLGVADQAAARSGKMSAATAQVTDIQAKLTKHIDSKHAKIGEEVMAKTTSAATLADGTRLPKGTKLLGHVTEVSRETHENRRSSLAFAFNEAMLRNGRTVPIHAVLRSLTVPRPLTADANSGFGSQTGAGPMQSGGMMSAGGGGMMGGPGVVRGGAIRGGGLLNAGGSVAGASMGNLQATTHTAGAATMGMMHAAPEGQGRMLGAASTAAVNGGAGASMMPVGNMRGVTFDGSGDASSSAVLEGRGKNISLESGSQMTLAVSASH